MVKTDIFKNLKFEKTNAEFKDGRKIVSGYIEGSFTKEEIRTKLQQLSDGIYKKSKNAYIGVAIHYDDPNAWLPAVFTKCGDPVRIFNPADSDTTHDYNSIDGCMFYILQLDEGKNLDQTHHKPKKQQNDTGFMFGKKKKS